MLAKEDHDSLLILRTAVMVKHLQEQGVDPLDTFLQQYVSGRKELHGRDEFRTDFLELPLADIDWPVGLKDEKGKYSSLYDAK